MASLLVEGDFFFNPTLICIFNRHIWNPLDNIPCPALEGCILNQIFKLEENKGSSLCVTQFLCQTWLPRAELGNHFECFWNTWGKIMCNVWILPYLYVHHKNFMAMLKCVLRGNAYLPLKIEFPNGAFISDTFLRSCFYVPDVAKGTCIFYLENGSFSPVLAMFLSMVCCLDHGCTLDMSCPVLWNASFSYQV